MIGSVIDGGIVDLRNFLLASGWADYTDTSHTVGSPQSITALTDTKITNNAATTRVQEIPLTDYPNGFFDSVAQKILGRAGDSLLITIQFTCQRQVGTTDFDIELFFDIGGSVGELYNRTINIKGNTPNKITFTTAVYTLDTWQENGADIMINSDVDINLYDLRFVVYRLHRGIGIYPPP